MSRRSYSCEARFLSEFEVLYPTQKALGSEVEHVPALDIVNVHGLGSNFDRSWTHWETGKNWLTDPEFLQHDIPDCRIITCNHDSVWDKNASIQDIRDYGDNLLASLRILRASEDERRRPLIFVGHSFGGLIVKQALAIANERFNEKGNTFYKDIVECSRGFVFLGTPHGGHNFTLPAYLKWFVGTPFGSRRELLTLLEKRNPRRRELNDVFLRSFKDRKIHCFFEAKTTSWIYPYLVVDKDDAVIPGYSNCVLNVSHPELNKFRSADDQNYLEVVEILLQMADDCRKFNSETLPIMTMSRSETLRSDYSPSDSLMKDLRKISLPRLELNDGLEVADHQMQKSITTSPVVKHFVVPYPRQTDYVLRGSILETLQELHRVEDPAASLRPNQPRAVLYGLGGIGYSQ